MHFYSISIYCGFHYIPYHELANDLNILVKLLLTILRFLSKIRTNFIKNVIIYKMKMQSIVNYYLRPC